MEPIKHWLMQKSSTGAVVLLSVALGASLDTGAEATTAIDGFWLANSKRSVELR